MIRYPILRTAFDWQDGVIQIITKTPSIDDANFVYKDISHLAEPERVSAIVAIQQQDRTLAFDLTKPGLLRFTVIKQQANLYTVLKSEHHSIMDGWSGQILLKTVHDDYDALMQGQSPVMAVDTVWQQVQVWQGQQHQHQTRFWER